MCIIDSHFQQAEEPVIFLFSVRNELRCMADPAASDPNAGLHPETSSSLLPPTLYDEIGNTKSYYQQRARNYWKAGCWDQANFWTKRDSIK